MSSKKQTPKGVQESSKKKPAMPAAETPDKTTQEQSQPTPAIQQARRGSRPLLPGDITQLQQMIGNQAVGHLLADTKKPQERTSDPFHEEQLHPEMYQVEQNETQSSMIAMRAPKMPESKEVRLPWAKKNETFEWLDGSKTIHDPFDQTLTTVLPDGSGWQVTYVYDDKPGEAAPEAHVERTEPLSPLRVKALGFLDAKQGTAQETEDKRQTRLSDDQDTARANMKVWLKKSPENNFLLAEYTSKVSTYNTLFKEYVEKLKDYPKLKAEARRTGQKSPPIPIPPVQPKRPSGMPIDPRTTLCNGFPREMGEAISDDKSSKGLGGMKLSDIAKNGSWCTLETNPEGPKPGDICSLSTAGARNQPDDNKRSLMHVGIFKSRRTGGPKGLEIWTFVDGGQGAYEKIQQIQERTRFFNPETGVLSTKTADAGQSADDRWLRGWVDIDSHFMNPNESADDIYED